MNRRSWLSGMLASLAGAFGFSKAEALVPLHPEKHEFHTTKLDATEWYKLKVATLELPLGMAPTGSSLVINSYYTFDTIENLFARIDKIVEEYNEHGGYVTFSQTGTDMPFEDEAVLTIYRQEILCPRSAGGFWAAWDDYRKRCRECNKKATEGCLFCEEHKPVWKERWYD